MLLACIQNKGKSENVLFLLVHLTAVSHDKGIYIEFATASLIVHVPNLTEDSPLLPAHVMDAANGPHAAHIAVGVATIQTVLVVQQDRVLQRLLRCRCPFQNLFGPVHAQKAVHLSLAYQLQLRRVPQVVISERLGKNYKIILVSNQKKKNPW